MRHLLYCHLVWTTAGRAPLIDANLARFLCRFLRQIAREERAHILEIGMVATHLHALVRIHPLTNLPHLLQRLKGSSAAVAGKERRSSGDPLRWAKGYAVHSVNVRQLDLVRRYLRDQQRRHPAAAIPGWEGDAAEYEPGAMDEWRGPERRRIR